MEKVFDGLGSWIVTQGGTVMLLALGIWWLSRRNDAAAVEVKEALAVAQEERSERFKMLEGIIQALETRVNSCEVDRSNLWSKIVDLAKSQKP